MDGSPLSLGVFFSFSALGARLKDPLSWSGIQNAASWRTGTVSFLADVDHTLSL